MRFTRIRSLGLVELGQCVDHMCIEASDSGSSQKQRYVCHHLERTSSADWFLGRWQQKEHWKERCCRRQTHHSTQRRSHPHHDGCRSRQCHHLHAFLQKCRLDWHHHRRQPASQDSLRWKVHGRGCWSSFDRLLPQEHCVFQNGCPHSCLGFIQRFHQAHCHQAKVWSWILARARQDDASISRDCVAG